jgi:hypothetical protein
MLEQDEVDGINGQFVRGRSSEEDVFNEVTNDKPAKVTMKTIQQAYSDAQEIQEKH